LTILLSAPVVLQEPPQQDAAAIALERARELIYRVGDDALRKLRSDFRVTIRGFPRRDEAIVVTGRLRWHDDGLQAQVKSGEADQHLVITQLRDLETVLRHGSLVTSALADAEGEMVGERRIQILSGEATRPFPDGWVSNDGTFLELDERGLISSQLTIGQPAPQLQKIGFPDKVETRLTWKEHDGRFLLTGMVVAFAIRGEDGDHEAAYPMSRMEMSFDYQKVGDVVLPSRLSRSLRFKRGDQVKTRTEELVLTGVRLDGTDNNGDWSTLEQLRTPAEPEPELLAVGTEAPAFELATPSGDKVELAALRGRVVVLDFWSTWCGPCLRAMPALQQIQERFAGRRVSVLGIDVWQDRDPDGDPVETMRERGCTYPLLLNGDDVAKRYHVTAIPTLYVIGADGRIAHVEEGFDEELMETLTAVIEKALANDG